MSGNAFKFAGEKSPLRELDLYQIRNGLIGLDRPRLPS